MTPRICRGEADPKGELYHINNIIVEAESDGTRASDREEALGLTDTEDLYLARSRGGEALLLSVQVLIPLITRHFLIILILSILHLDMNIKLKFLYLTLPSLQKKAAITMSSFLDREACPCLPTTTNNM